MISEPYVAGSSEPARIMSADAEGGVERREYAGMPRDSRWSHPGHLPVPCPCP